MSFAAEISSFSKGTQRKLDRVRRGVTIELMSAVIMDTPVLDGRLRGNWQLTEGQPAQGELNIEDKSGAPTVLKMIEGVEKTTPQTTAVYLTNNLPYGPRIEFDGWSHEKAPEGMVRRNVVRFNGLIEIENRKAQK